MTRLIRVELVIHREDEGGKEYTIKADITAEYGWNQWGEPATVLGDNVELMTALTDAVLDES